MSVFSLILLGLLGAEQVIDDFSYPNTAAAQIVWVAKSATPPVEVVHTPTQNGEQTHPVLKVFVPFATDPQLTRTVIDRAPSAYRMRRYGLKARVASERAAMAAPVPM